MFSIHSCFDSADSASALACRRIPRDLSGVADALEIAKQTRQIRPVIAGQSLDFRLCFAGRT